MPIRVYSQRYRLDILGFSWQAFPTPFELCVNVPIDEDLRQYLPSFFNGTIALTTGTLPSGLTIADDRYLRGTISTALANNVAVRFTATMNGISRESPDFTIASTDLASILTATLSGFSIRAPGVTAMTIRNGIIWAADGQGLITISEAGVVTNIANAAYGQAVRALEEHNGTLYAGQANTYLYRVNATTGALTAIGEASLPGTYPYRRLIALASLGNTLYGFMWFGAPSQPRGVELVSINTTTGAMTPLGRILNLGNISHSVNAGNLFIHDNLLYFVNNGRLYKFNNPPTNTSGNANITLIGNYGIGTPDGMISLNNNVYYVNNRETELRQLNCL